MKPLKTLYVYAYPLMTMDLTRRVTTNVASPEGTSAPVGQFAKLREYPNASFNAVTAPNADTLYTMIWLDLLKEPWVISIPDLKGRYALFPIPGRLDHSISEYRESEPREPPRRNTRLPARVGAERFQRA